MSVQIDLNQPPFSFLSPQQRDWLVQRLDLVFLLRGKSLSIMVGLHLVYT